MHQEGIKEVIIKTGLDIYDFFAHQRAEMFDLYMNYRRNINEEEIFVIKNIYELILIIFCRLKNVELKVFC